MRWLALVPYAVLVAFVSVNVGAQQGLIVLTCALILTACFRPMAAGAVIRSSARRLCRADNGVPADLVPAPVRAARRAVHILLAPRALSGDAVRPTPASGEETLVLVLLNSGQAGAADPHRTTEILASGEDGRARS
jgi:hypothetical protein